MQTHAEEVDLRAKAPTCGSWVSFSPTGWCVDPYLLCRGLICVLDDLMQWLASPFHQQNPSHKTSSWCPGWLDFAMRRCIFTQGAASWILKGMNIVDNFLSKIPSGHFYMWSSVLILTFLAQYSLSPLLPTATFSSQFCTKMTHETSEGVKLHSMMTGNARIQRELLDVVCRKREVGPLSRL